MTQESDPSGKQRKTNVINLRQPACASHSLLLSEEGNFRHAAC